MNQQALRVRLADGREFGPASPELLAQWAREGRIPRDAAIVSDDGSALPAIQHPVLVPIFGAPPVVRPLVAPADEPMSGLIPYRNPPALTGYYISVASLIPGLGLLLGPAAIVLGVIGFRAYRREPQKKGQVHAWVAIILGSLTTLLYWGFVVLVIVMVARDAARPVGSPGRAAARARPGPSAPSPAPDAAPSTAPAPR
jgi:hypothetical protein